MRPNVVATSLALSLLVLSAFPFAPRSLADQQEYRIPSVIKPTDRFLFFFHNYYVETKGPDGDCRYYDLLKTFSDRGFIVISELRTKDASVIEAAGKAAIKIQRLLEDGVPPENITVAGHSKGAVIALQVAAMLEKPKVNYLIMAGCGIKGLEKGYPEYSRLKGNLLSVLATSDRVAGSCRDPLSRAKELSKKEILLESPAGHQLFFKPADLWVEPVMAWLKQPK